MLGCEKHSTSWLHPLGPLRLSTACPDWSFSSEMVNTTTPVHAPGPGSEQGLLTQGKGSHLGRAHRK